MDFLIHFFRDVLDGPLYWVLVGVCFFLIIFILGFLVDRREKRERLNNMAEASPSGKSRMYVTDEFSKIEHPVLVNNPNPSTPINKVEEQNESDTKSVAILELSSEDYQDNAEEIPDNNNN